MFRRSGKNGHEEHNALYQEDQPIASPFNKYTLKKESGETQQRVFEPPIGGRAPTGESLSENWANLKTTPLPHHFEGMVGEENPETTLGAGVTFRGQLSFERFLRIDGSFEGELISQGKVVVGPTGKVKAHLNLREAIIEGTVEGNITVQEKLELRGEANVKGDICAKSLCVDEGVTISGYVIVAPQNGADPLPVE